MSIKQKLKELNLISFSKRVLASPSTIQYSTERRGLVGDAPKSTKLIQSRVDYQNDWVGFFFLTTATPKYGDDYEYKDVLPKANFSFEPNPSELYDIQLRFFGIAKLMELLKNPPAEGIKSLQAKPVAKYPTGQPQVQPVEPTPEQPFEEEPEPEPEEEPVEDNVAVDAITPGQATGEPNPDEEIIRRYHNQKESLQEKIVDIDIVYHSTNNEPFDKFDLNKTGDSGYRALSGFKAAFFSSAPGKRYGKNVMKAKLRVTNPLYVDIHKVPDPGKVYEWAREHSSEKNDAVAIKWGDGSTEWIVFDPDKSIVSKEWMKETEPKNYTVYNMVKNWLWATDFGIWDNDPSFHYQGFNYNLSVLGASIHPTNIEPKVWNKIHGDALIGKHLYELFLHIPFFINQMASSLLNKIRQKKESINPETPSLASKMNFKGQLSSYLEENPEDEIINVTLINTNGFPGCTISLYEWTIPPLNMHWWAIEIYSPIKNWSNVYYFKSAITLEQSKVFIEEHGKLPNEPAPTMFYKDEEEPEEETDPSFNPFEGEEMFKEAKNPISVKGFSALKPSEPEKKPLELAYMLSIKEKEPEKWHAYVEKLLSDPMKFKIIKNWLKDQSLYYGLKYKKADDISDFVPDKILYMAFQDYAMDNFNPDSEAYNYGYNHPWEILKSEPANLPENPGDYWDEKDPNYWSDEQKEQAGQEAEESSMNEYSKTEYNSFDSQWQSSQYSWGHDVVDSVYKLVIQNFFSMESYKEQTIQMTINFIELFMDDIEHLADNLEEEGVYAPGNEPEEEGVYAPGNEPEEEEEPEEIDPNFNPFEGEEMFKEDWSKETGETWMYTDEQLLYRFFKKPIMIKSKNFEIADANNGYSLWFHMPNGNWRPIALIDEEDGLYTIDSAYPDKTVQNALQYLSDTWGISVRQLAMVN